MYSGNLQGGDWLTHALSGAGMRLLAEPRLWQLQRLSALGENLRPRDHLLMIRFGNNSAIPALCKSDWLELILARLYPEYLGVLSRPEHR